MQQGHSLLAGLLCTGKHILLECKLVGGTRRLHFRPMLQRGQFYLLVPSGCSWRLRASSTRSGEQIAKRTPACASWPWDVHVSCADRCRARYRGNTCLRVTRGARLLAVFCPRSKFYRSCHGASSDRVTAEQLERAGCWVPPEVLADADALAAIMRRALLPVLPQLQLNRLVVHARRLARHMFTLASHADGVSFCAAGGLSGFGQNSAATPEQGWPANKLQQHGDWQQTIDAARGAGGRLLDTPGQLLSAFNLGRGNATKEGLTLPSGSCEALMQWHAERDAGAEQLAPLRSLQATYATHVQQGIKRISLGGFPQSVDSQANTEAAAERQEQEAAAWLEWATKPLPDVWAAVEAAHFARIKATALAKAIRSVNKQPDKVDAPL